MLDEIYSDVSLGAVPVLRSRYTVVGGRESVAMRRCASPWAVRRVNSGVQKSVHGLCHSQARLQLYQGTVGYAHDLTTPVRIETLKDPCKPGYIVKSEGQAQHNTLGSLPGTIEQILL